MTQLPERRACKWCGYSQRMRVNGGLERHYLYAGNGRWACPGGETHRTKIDTPRFPLATFLSSPTRGSNP